jgi:hypothetical protein
MLNRLADGGRMEAPQRVICLDLDVRLSAAGHHHALGVETRDADGSRRRWSSVQVIGAVRDGARFVIEDAPEASLEPGLCPICPFVTLRVEGPAQLASCEGTG